MAGKMVNYASLSMGEKFVLNQVNPFFQKGLLYKRLTDIVIVASVTI